MVVPVTPVPTGAMVVPETPVPTGALLVPETPVFPVGVAAADVPVPAGIVVPVVPVVVEKGPNCRAR